MSELATAIQMTVPSSRSFATASDGVHGRWTKLCTRNSGTNPPSRSPETCPKQPKNAPATPKKQANFPISFQERISPEAATGLAPTRISQIPVALFSRNCPQKTVAEAKSVRYSRAQRPSAVRVPCEHPLSQQAWRPKWDDHAERQLR